MKNRQEELLELLDKLGASLYGLLTKLTLCEDVAEELMQELFIKLNNSSGLDKVENWAAYARKAAINLAFDWRRRQKTTTLRLDQAQEPASNENSPLTKMIETEQLQEVLSAIGRLNAPSRQALVMRYIQQQSYDYIAEQLCKTPHQVRALCSKALKNLRDTFGRNQPQPSQKEAHDVEN